MVKGGRFPPLTEVRGFQRTSPMNIRSIERVVQLTSTMMIILTLMIVQARKDKRASN